MLPLEVSVILTEGLIFGLVAIGIFIAFNWLRFPDLTPDGSFALGAVVYSTAVSLGAHPVFGLILSVMSGIAAGGLTALTNRVARVPAVVSGLLVSSILYSVAWLILQKPNQFIDGRNTVVGDHTFAIANIYFGILLILLSLLIITALASFASTVWGLRIRAMGENFLLPRDLDFSATRYTVGGLALANGLIGLAGSFFAQKSYSADINMGLGVTVTGLAVMIVGLALASGKRKVWIVLSAIMFGAVLYKTLIFLILKVGLPAEAFRLVSGFLLIVLFLVLRLPAVDFIRKIRWN